MNARYNGKMRIDIWMPSREEAIEFGAQWIEMEVY
jgi:3D (Asp-Asp-Asp) domain-containing protein